MRTLLAALFFSLAAFLARNAADEGRPPAMPLSLDARDMALVGRFLAFRWAAIRHAGALGPAEVTRFICGEDEGGCALARQLTVTDTATDQTAGQGDDQGDDQGDAQGYGQTAPEAWLVLTPGSGEAAYQAIADIPPALALTDGGRNASSSPQALLVVFMACENSAGIYTEIRRRLGAPKGLSPVCPGAPEGTGEEKSAPYAGTCIPSTTDMETAGNAGRFPVLREGMIVSRTLVPRAALGALP